MDTRTWAQRFPMWDAYFGLVAVATAGFVAATGRAPVATRAGALGLLAGLGVWYWLWGRPLMRAEIEDRRGYVYLVGVAVLLVPAVALVEACSYTLLALCPQAYMLMAAVRATVAVAILNAADVLVDYASTRDLADTAQGPLPAALMIVAGSAVIGTWARQVSAQNDERARLISQLDGSRAEVARLSREAGTLAERQRLAGDIHDTVAQGLSSLIMLIQAAEADIDRNPARARRHLGLAVDAARDNLAETRALVGALTPTELAGSTPAESSLAGALARLVDRFAGEEGADAFFESVGRPGPLPTAVEVVLLRAVQESLSNVRKHAGAGRVSVRLEHGDGSTVVTVTDDGCGFAPGQARRGYGLSGMRARVEQVSGRLSVDSAPGRGTVIRVEVPVP